MNHPWKLERTCLYGIVTIGCRSGMAAKHALYGPKQVLIDSIECIR